MTSKYIRIAFHEFQDARKRWWWYWRSWVWEIYPQYTDWSKTDAARWRQSVELHLRNPIAASLVASRSSLVHAKSMSGFARISVYFHIKMQLFENHSVTWCWEAWKLRNVWWSDWEVWGVLEGLEAQWGLVLIVLLMWWGVEDWDGLDIWNVRV